LLLGYEKAGQRSLNPFKSNASMVHRLLDYIIAEQNTTVVFVGLSSLPLFKKKILLFIAA